MKLAWKKRKHIKAKIRCVVSFFVFCQANFILVPFPAHRQHVRSMHSNGTLLLPLPLMLPLDARCVYTLTLSVESVALHERWELVSVNNVYLYKIIFCE